MCGATMSQEAFRRSSALTVPTPVTAQRDAEAAKHCDPGWMRFPCALILFSTELQTMSSLLWELRIIINLGMCEAGLWAKAAGDVYLLCEAGVLLQEQCWLHLYLYPIFLHVTQRCEKEVALQSSLYSLNIQSFGSQRPLKAEMGVQTCVPGWVTESQNHSMVEAGRALCGSPSPTSC